ncbi:hypothetical protein B0A48_10906 [Cryoendolithus antarcticus]|uniref:Uncharacterized protein n=1 Tax=Cryoendolithus antarcticus TaxID=1507870 RepID=A0A1V8SYQ4_9PEZI|nr:hypothetical protein B0A48_10906 [Cryoendolithus antarcticus]
MASAIPALTVVMPEVFGLPSSPISPGSNRQPYNNRRAVDDILNPRRSIDAPRWDYGARRSSSRDPVLSREESYNELQRQPAWWQRRPVVDTARHGTVTSSVEEVQADDEGHEQKGKRKRSLKEGLRNVLKSMKKRVDSVRSSPDAKSPKEEKSFEVIGRGSLERLLRRNAAARGDEPDDEALYDEDEEYDDQDEESYDGDAVSFRSVAMGGADASDYHGHTLDEGEDQVGPSNDADAAPAVLRGEVVPQARPSNTVMRSASVSVPRKLSDAERMELDYMALQHQRSMTLAQRRGVFCDYKIKESFADAGRRRNTSEAKQWRASESLRKEVEKAKQQRDKEFRKVCEINGHQMGTQKRRWTTL